MISEMPQTPEEIGQLIKQLRKQKGLTQTELGEKMGLKKSAIALHERGQKGLTVATLNRFAEALGANLSINLNLE